MEFLTALAFVGMTAAQVNREPVLWLQPNGAITIEGRETKPHIVGGVRRYRTQHGVTYDFDGQRSAFEFGDEASLRINGAITVSAWINLRSYVNDGPGAQVLFRGDDRCGLDPYSMSITSDGTVNFLVTGEDTTCRSVKADIPLGVWTHVVANLDDQTGQIKLWINGDLKAMTTTTARPFVVLDKAWAPGVSVGNVQNDHGPHNQPINGQIADLRLYRVALTPDEVGYSGGGGVEPPLARMGPLNDR